MAIDAATQRADADLARQKIAILIPCRNEGPTIGTVVADFRRHVGGASVWVCDNASTDATAQRAVEAGAAVVFEPRSGKGHAVRRLFAAVDADLYVLVDGDGTYAADSAPALLHKMLAEKLDMVVARRVTPEDSLSAAYRAGHVSANRGFARLISLLFGYRLEDIFSGYRVFSRRFVRSFPALSGGFEIETELTIHALDLDLPIAEVPSPYGARPEGSSSKLHTYRDGLRITRTLLHLYAQVRPSRFYGSLAALAALSSLALGLPVVFEFLETGLVPRLPTAVLASALMVLAALAFGCGIVLDSVGRGRKEAKRLAYLAADRR
ncbi:MAG TPA: glycosyltransferase [Casimicrobiaceae bacterium]